MFSDAAIHTGLTLRQANGLVATLLALAFLDWPVPDHSTYCRRQKPLSVAVAHRPSTGALHLLVDSVGIKAEGDGARCARKHGPSMPQSWRKVPLGIDAETLEIRAVRIPGAGVGDASMLPELLARILEDQPIGRVSADGADDTRACHKVIANRNAITVIPTRRLGRTIWRRWSGYHRRRLVETKMDCFKLL